jgi:hypothetical protein
MVEHGLRDRRPISLLLPDVPFNGFRSLPGIYCLEGLKFLFLVRLLHKLGLSHKVYDTIGEPRETE